MKRQPIIDPSHEVMIENQHHIQSIRQQTDLFLREKGHKPRSLIKTYGCQMNEHDSEKLSAMLLQMGYEPTEVLTEADLIIYNTCCVRENAEFKVYGNIGAIKPLKEKNKDLILAVCGCMMQQDHVVTEIKSKYRQVDLVFGTHNLHTFPKLLKQVIKDHKRVVDVWDAEEAIIEGLPVVRKKDLKAYVNIMFGCDNFCTYCIVPYTRGRERSRLPQDIIHEVKTLIEEGTKEITLLGQNVNSYGNDFDEPYGFTELLEAIDGIEGIGRVRFMTPHPKDFSDDLIDAMSRLKSLCNSVHLPVQAGSNALLKAMNRKYTREDYLTLVQKIKAKIPDVTLSTDIIVGFPGETEQDIDDLIDLIQQVAYDNAFTFMYSKREGTPAAAIEDQIDEKTKHMRFERMLKALNDIVIEKNKAMENQVVEVLVEGKCRLEGHVTARTRNNRVVNVRGEESLIGSYQMIKVTKANHFSLQGELV